MLVGNFLRICAAYISTESIASILCEEKRHFFMSVFSVKAKFQISSFGTWCRLICIIYIEFVEDPKAKGI